MCPELCTVEVNADMIASCLGSIIMCKGGEPENEATEMKTVTLFVLGLRAYDCTYACQYSNEESLLNIWTGTIA